MSIPQIPHYEFLELIGEGCCGYVYRCRYREADERMVKVVNGLAVNHKLFPTTMKTVAAARAHHYLVDVCGYEFGENPGYYITSLHGMQAADGKWKASTIEPLLGNLTIEESLMLIDQMADGLAYLHRLEVPHTAFKPSNVFVDENPDGSPRIRIAGWGEGYVSDLHYLQLGDRGFYASPEQLANGDFSQGRGKRWDVYSFGVVAYRLLTGVFPRLDPQFDHYQELKSRHDLSDPDALAYSKILEEPASYEQWITEQPEIGWPGRPRSQTEADRRRVIEQCLEMDPEKRFGDMREVVAAFRQVENDFLLRRMERDLATRSQKMAEELELKVDAADARAEKRRRQVIKWRLFAVGLVATVGLLGWGAFKLISREFQLASEEIDELKADSKRRIAEERLRFDMALAEKDTVVATVERTAVKRNEAADAARDVLRDAQSHGDRLFDMILSNRDSDIPGYRDERREHLIEARDHYESLVEVYANNPGFVEQSAYAFRYLGEIYLEVGEDQRATEAFGQAAQRLGDLKASGGADRARKAGEALAKVRQRQAELAVRLQPAATESLTAIDAAQAAWKELADAEPDELQWQLAQAQSQHMHAEVLRARGDLVAAMTAFEQSADQLVAMHEKTPGNAAVTAALGRVFASIGGMLSDAGEMEEAEALLDQSVVLFSEAVTLNGAVEDYQFWMAESLARLGGIRRDAKALNDAVTVLSVAQSRSPKNSQVAATLATCLGTLAEMQRDGGETATAIGFEKRAVDALQQVLENNLGGPAYDVRSLLAERRCHLAELQGDAEQYGESKNAVDSAIETINELLKANPDNVNYKSQLARAQGLSAYASEKLGEKEAARAMYSAALTQWQALATTHPEDTEASEGKAWAQRQLDSLK